MSIPNERKVAWIADVLTDHLVGTSSAWFRDTILPLNQEEICNKFSMLFSRVPRFIPGTMAEFSREQIVEAEQFYPGFSPESFNQLQLCRLFLMVKLPTGRNQEILKLIFETAEINELVILYRGLYWMENASDFVLRLTEGIRTNMADVFDAIACENPYPFYYLADEAWNQMVLKAIFMGRPLYRIYKLQERKNQKLALILHDYIHERWSAGRAITPELWQLMPGFMTSAIEADLQHAARSADPLEQAAARKALAESGIRHYTVDMTWREIGIEFNKKKK